ncbi:MAG: ABC transporter permease, partial [Candidatus Binatia bacterium]
YGAIDMLRSRLVQNPSFRELWPVATLNLDNEWFDTMRQRPDVEFVIPTILRGASVIGVRTGTSGKTNTFDIIPTADGDPLLQVFGASIPSEGEIVLSRAAAEQLGKIEAGADVALEITRQRGGRRDRENVPVRVIAILPFEADGLQRVYAPVRLATAVERYREGLAVPEFGWSGDEPRPFLSFDGVIVAVQEPLEVVEKTSLRIGTGFASVEVMPLNRLAHLTGLSPPVGWTTYDVRTSDSTAFSANIARLQEKLRGRGAALLPYAEPMTIRVDGLPRNIVGLSLGKTDAALFGVEPTPWGAFAHHRQAADLMKMVRPVADGSASAASAEVDYADYAVTFPLKVVGHSDTAIVPVELLATLKTGSNRRIAWDARTIDFVLTRSGYFGFRLYANSINRVPGLYRALTAQGLRVDAHVQEIERIQVLDRGLFRLFLMVAAVGAIGGASAMVASLYATVDRKKRELGVMRLLGLTRIAVSSFPIFQGLILSAIATILAVATFLAFSIVINVSFADEVVAGGKICHLPLRYYAYIGSFTLVLALLSSVIAARRATGIEPAEAIREE